MYLIPADRLAGSPFMSREPTTKLSIRREKKRDPYADARKIRKHHPYEEWLKLRKKMDEADLRKKTEANMFADFLSKVMPKGQAAPPPPPSTPQKMRRGIQTAVTSASVTATPPPPPPPIKEYTYEPPKKERVEDDDDEDDYNDDDNFVEDEAREYGRENVGPVASPYLMPYV